MPVIKPPKAPRTHLMCDWRGYWLWPATEDSEKQWQLPLHYKEWKLVRILAEDLPRDFPFKIGDWLKRVLWTDHSSEDDEGFETISKIPPSNQLFPDQLALWSRWRNSPHDIGDYLTLFSVKPATKKEVIDDPLANGYRAVPMPTSTCTNVIDWLEEILKERGKGFGFGVGLVPLEELEGGVDSMDVDHMSAESPAVYWSPTVISDSGGNSPGGDAATSPPRQEPPLVKPARMREASAAGTHWRKTKWEVCRSGLQLLKPFLISNAPFPPTGEILQINMEGSNLRGSFDKSFVFHQAEIGRQKCDILRSDPDQLHSRVSAQNLLSALWHPPRLSIGKSLKCHHVIA
jgi:hypothetical protein